MPGPGRRVSKTATGSSTARRSATESAIAEAVSTHWASSTATRRGSSRARALSVASRATATARGPTGAPRVSSRSSAPASGCRCGGGRPRICSWTSASRSPTVANDSSRSASAGRATSTRNPYWRACSTPADQSVVLPIPASPSSTSAAAPEPLRARNSSIRASSSSRPSGSRARVRAAIPCSTSHSYRWLPTRLLTPCSRGASGETYRIRVMEPGVPTAR
jgi:hypothetical protein